MIQSVIEWASNTVDEKFLLAMIIVTVVVIGVCCVIAIASLDRDNKDLQDMIDEILKEKEALKEKKKACQKIGKEQHYE